MPLGETTGWTLETSCDNLWRKVHFQSWHRPYSTSVIPTGVKSCECKECKEGFRYQSHHIQHESSCSKEKDSKSGECRKAFHSRSDLIKPQRIHESKKMNEKRCAFICDSEMTKLESIATSVKPHKCKECGKTFHCGSQLVKHQRILLVRYTVNVRGVRRPFHLPHNFIYTREFMQRGNTRNVRKMEKPSPVPLTLFNIRESTLVRNPRSVRMWSSFRYDTQRSLHQVIHTGERPMNGRKEGRHRVLPRDWVHIEEFILAGNLINVRDVGASIRFASCLTSECSYW